MNINFLELQMDIVWFVLAAYGLTQILVYGSIFDQIRPAKDAYRGWGKVWHCPMCMGFWVGALLFTLNGFTELFTFDYTFANFLICGWMASGTSYFLSMLVNDDGIKFNNGDKK